MRPNDAGPRRARVVLAALALLLLVGCAAGPISRWAPPAEPAGFWAGLWHGILLLITLVVSFFTNDVRIYEVHNTGIPYDIGFVLGVLGVSGSGLRITTCRQRPRPKPAGPDGDEVARRVEKKVRAQVSSWVDEEDWAEIGARLEKKVKEGLRRWLAEDEAENEDAKRGS